MHGNNEASFLFTAHKYRHEPQKLQNNIFLNFRFSSKDENFLFLKSLHAIWFKVTEATASNSSNMGIMVQVIFTLYSGIRRFN